MTGLLVDIVARSAVVLSLITRSSAPRHGRPKHEYKRKLHTSHALDARCLINTSHISQSPHHADIDATNLLKLGCPGVWLFGAALLPCGGGPLIRFPFLRVPLPCCLKTPRCRLRPGSQYQASDHLPEQRICIHLPYKLVETMYK